MTFIRTVTGDISPAELGACYPHEHLIGQPPANLATPDLTLDSQAAALQELRWFREAGGSAIVEMTTPDYGRNAALLRNLAEMSGVKIIAASGYNKEKFSRPYLEDASVDELTERFIGEVTQGMNGTSIRAGLVKASSTKDEISPLAEKMFHAAAQAHLATGAPISTHTEAGTMALEQVALLSKEGVAPQHIIIGHVDRRLEWDFLLDLASTGVYLGFDQISKEKYYPDHLRIEMILRLVAAGFAKQILLSGDLARRSYWPSYGTGGGPGLTYILWRFVPWLREAGLGESEVQDLIVHNPARALSFRIV
jgi:phosphotriesterase-related protein